jgi:glycosyltransferase involved in cell wall biosynthesis
VTSRRERPRAAVACSGLGHVQRGIESWASDLARGLQQAGIDVTLFGGARPAEERGQRRAGDAGSLRYDAGWGGGAAGCADHATPAMPAAEGGLTTSFRADAVGPIPAWQCEARPVRTQAVDACATGKATDEPVRVSDEAAGAPAEVQAATGDDAGPAIVPLPCLRRTGSASRSLARVLRCFGGWRYACGSPYEIEQTSFAFSLWRRIRRDFDILHVQDPAIATWFEQAYRRGLSRPRVIYANGTGEDAATMRRFAHLQLLTPQAMAAWQPHRPADQAVFMIPNFVDTAHFTPGDRVSARAQFGLPCDRLIVLCCAAIRRRHKRIDRLLAGFGEALRQTGADAMLVVAGGREADTDALIAEGQALFGDRVRFFPDLPRASMPALYRAADLFTLASLQEMFGIVLIEAMASGRPIACHDTAEFRAIVGPAGLYGDFAADEGLAATLAAAFDPARRSALAAAARPHVIRHYSEMAVIPQVQAMYDAVLVMPGRKRAAG